MEENSPTFIKIENSGVTRELKKSLLTYIRQSVAVGKFRLPSEVNIAAEIGVSRIALREALKEFRNEGIIYSIHGSGTFINKNFTDMKFRITPALEFQRGIDACGHAAKVDLVDWQVIDALPSVADDLHLGPDAKVLSLCKVFFADDVPVIFCNDILPFRFLEHVELKKEELIVSTFEYFYEKTGIRVENDIVTVSAVLGSELPDPFEKYRQDMASIPMLKMESVYYTNRQEPVMEVHAFFDTRNLKMSQLRKQAVYGEF